MKKTICLILTAFVAGCQFLAAQSNRNDTIAGRNVVIERDYVPTVSNVKKLEVAPTITEPQIIKSDVNYSETLFQKTPDYEVDKWPAAAIHLDQASYKKGYALLGFGIYGTALGDLFYPIIDEAGQTLKFDAHVHGLFGNKQQQLITNFGLDYLKQFENFDLNAGVYFKRNGFNYYGTNSPYHTLENANYKDSTNNFINFGLKAGISSKNDETAVAYKAGVSFNSFMPGTGLGEQQLRIKGNVDIPVEEYRLGIAIDNYNFIYNQYKGTTIYPSHSIVGVNPYFLLSGDDWKVRLGLKNYFSTKSGDNGLHLMPDITAQVNLIKTVLLYAGICGQYNVNSMQQITDENPYIDPTVRVNDSYAPIDAFLGIKFSPLSGLLIDGSLGYTRYNKLYFYDNETYTITGMQPAVALLTNPIFLPTFNVLYDKTNLVTAKLNVGYNWKDEIMTHLNIKYNGWDPETLDKAWMRPSTEIELGGEAKITRNVFVSANYYFAGGMYAYRPIDISGKNGSIKMNNKSDLSLGASYSYSDWLTAFIRVNNVFSTKYQNWYGYDALQLNWQLGAAISF